MSVIDPTQSRHLQKTQMVTGEAWPPTTTQWAGDRTRVTKTYPYPYSCLLVNSQAFLYSALASGKFYYLDICLQKFKLSGNLDNSLCWIYMDAATQEPLRWVLGSDSLRSLSNGSGSFVMDFSSHLWPVLVGWGLALCLVIILVCVGHSASSSQNKGNWRGKKLPKISFHFALPTHLCCSRERCVSCMIPLLHLTLHKLRQEEVKVIAILPWWPRRGWFPLVRSLLVNLLVLYFRLARRPKESSGGVPSAPYPFGSRSFWGSCAHHLHWWETIYARFVRCQVAELFALVSRTGFQSPLPNSSASKDYLEPLADIPLKHNTIWLMCLLLVPVPMVLRKAAYESIHMSQSGCLVIKFVVLQLSWGFQLGISRLFWSLWLRSSMSLCIRWIYNTFLLALASAHRISELHSLSVEPPFFIELI